MVAFYVKRIKSGKMYLKDVPERWRAAVEEKLNADN
ncbi:MAG: CD1375 family protein [bacterium]|nr:CD1375 family protein [bacterium]